LFNKSPVISAVVALNQTPRYLSYTSWQTKFLPDKGRGWHADKFAHSSRTIGEVCKCGGSMPLLCTLAHSSWFSPCSNAYCRRSSVMSAVDASTSSMLALSDSFAVFNDVMYSQAFARTAHLLCH